MARIRQIKPEFWRSPDTAAASPVARLLYIAMWNWADDAGRGEADLKALEGFAFPNDDVYELSCGTSENFRHVLSEVQKCFGVEFYQVSGKPYYSIPSWADHQRNERIAKGKHPGPESGLTWDFMTEPTPGKTLRRKMSEVPKISDPVSGVQGYMVTGDHENAPEPEPEPDTDATPAPSSTASVPAELERDDVTRLCEHLRDRIVENGSRRPNISKGWRDAARLLLDKDGVSEAEAHRLIDWCQADGFWRSNILSLPKFREQFDKIRLQSNRPAQSSRFGRPSMTDNVQSLTRARNHLIASTADPVDSQPTLMLVSPQNHDERPF